MKKADLKSRELIASQLVIMVLLVLLSTGVALASSGAGHVVEAKHWTTDDWIRVMNFAVLMGALFFLLKKPVADALSGRIVAIKTQLEELEAKKNEAEKTLAEYEKKIATLEDEAGQIITQYKEQGEAAKKRILEAAAASAEKLADQAKRNIETEFKVAKQKLQAEMMTKALEKAEELVKKSISSDDQDRLVDEYLEKVVA
ncbi:MAG: ATP synthase F0 subunit B [Proteobacteria bacterium]|nr:ATP synthase F0 subunit B [Pseudomonadota bacterium]